MFVFVCKKLYCQQLLADLAAEALVKSQGVLPNFFMCASEIISSFRPAQATLEQQLLSKCKTAA